MYGKEIHISYLLKLKFKMYMSVYQDMKWLSPKFMLENIMKLEKIMIKLLK